MGQAAGLPPGYEGDLARQVAALSATVEAMQSAAKEVRQLAVNVGVLAEQMAHTKEQLDDVQTQVRTLVARPGKSADAMGKAFLSALAAGLAGALLALIFK
jgi:ABC-type transporter Mla subunit MlaD